MKKMVIIFFVVVAAVYLIPALTFPLKGVFGVACIIISCIKFSPKESFITATLLSVLALIDVILNNNINDENIVGAMIMGIIVYYITFYLIAGCTNALKKKNRELVDEIEKRKTAEKELRQQLTLMQRIMDTVPSPIFLKDLNYNYVACNHAFEEVLGKEKNEIIGGTSFDIAEESLAEAYLQKDIEVVNTLGSINYNETVKYADGCLHNILFNKTIFNDEDGNAIGILGVMTDITDRIKAEIFKQRIQEDRLMLSAVLENDRLKTEFLSNISHELRTPINVILSSLQLMEMYLSDTQYENNKIKLAKNISASKRNCYRLIKVSNNLIDISKIDAKAYVLHLRECDIVALIKEITLSAAECIENKGIKLSFSSTVEEKNMPCDDEKIERILLNLLSNATKFTPKGGTIEVEIQDRKDGIIINVKDNGIGIPKEKQNNIFERFYQVEEVFTRQHEGSGIGLCLVKSFIEIHNGSITLKSDAGKGAVFSVFLPFPNADLQIKNHSMPEKQTCTEKVNIEFSDIYSVRA